MVVGLAVALAQDIEVIGERDSRSTGAHTTLEASASGSEDLGHVVARAPGTIVRRLGGLGTFTTASIRGARTRQTEVFLDGIPLNPDGSAPFDLSVLPVTAVESVVVFRGGAPIRYLASPVGGVIDLRTTEDRSGTLRFGGGSFGSSRLSAAFGESVHLAAVDATSTTGAFPWFDDASTRYNFEDDRVRTRKNNDAVRGSALLRTGTGPVRILASVSAEDRGIPGFMTQPFEDARLTSRRGLLGAAVSGGRSQVVAHASAATVEVLDPSSEVGGGSVSASRAAGLRGDTSFHREYWALEGAGGVRSEGFGDAGRREVLNAAAALRWFPSQFVEIQGSSVALGVLDQDVPASTFLSPRGGLAWTRNGLEVFGGGGRTARVPDLQEKFGDEGLVRGNPELVPETGWTTHVGLAKRGPVSIEVTGFSQWIRDWIGWQSGTFGVVQAANLDAVRLIGGEGGAAVEWGALAGNASFLIVDARQTGTESIYRGNRLPSVPTVESWSSLSYGRELRVSTDVSATGGSFLDSANLTSQPPRVFLGATGRVERGPIAVELDIRNLTNRTVLQVPIDALAGTERGPRAVVDFVGYPLPGRSFMLSVTASR